MKGFETNSKKRQAQYVINPNFPTPDKKLHIELIYGSRKTKNHDKIQRRVKLRKFSDKTKFKQIYKIIPKSLKGSFSFFLEILYW